MLRVICFHCPEGVPRPFAGQKKIGELVSDSFGSKAQVEYEKGRPFVSGADGERRIIHPEYRESFCLEREGELWKLCKKGTSVELISEGKAYLSVAHSGKMAVCALSNQPVGIDVEPVSRTPRMLRKSFSEEEQEYCRIHESESLPPELVIFTRKEAIMKGSCQTTFRTYRELNLVKNGALRPEEAGLQLRSFLTDGYLISVASQTSLQIVEKKIFFLDTEKIGRG